MRLTAEARIVVVNIARRPEPEILLSECMKSINAKNDGFRMCYWQYYGAL